MTKKKLLKPKRVRFLLRAVVEYSMEDVGSISDLMERIKEDGECEITAVEIIEEK